MLGPPLKKKNHRLGSLNNRNLFSHRSGGWKSNLLVLADLISFYHDQLLTVVKAKATPECVLDIIIGTILLVTSGVSRKRIGDANFYSGYFEMDLDGYISYKELAEVTRQSVVK